MLAAVWCGVRTWLHLNSFRFSDSFWCQCRNNRVFAYTVDTVNWVRPDSIMLGCVRTSLDEDDEFQLLMIGCNNGDMAEVRYFIILPSFRSDINLLFVSSFESSWSWLSLWAQLFVALVALTCHFKSVCF